MVSSSFAHLTSILFSVFQQRHKLWTTARSMSSPSVPRNLEIKLLQPTNRPVRPEYMYFTPLRLFGWVLRTTTPGCPQRVHGEWDRFCRYSESLAKWSNHQSAIDPESLEATHDRPLVWTQTVWKQHTADHLCSLYPLVSRRFDLWTKFTMRKKGTRPHPYPILLKPMSCVLLSKRFCQFTLCNWALFILIEGYPLFTSQ